MVGFTAIFVDIYYLYSNQLIGKPIGKMSIGNLSMKVHWDIGKFYCFLVRFYCT